MEYILGRKLSRNELVHHIDKNKSNDHPSNLEVCSSKEHLNEKHPEFSERMKKDNPSKYWTENSKIKMSHAIKGKKRSIETRIKLREKKLGKNNPNYGKGEKMQGDKNPSKRPEVRKKMSEKTKQRYRNKFGRFIRKELL